MTGWQINGDIVRNPGGDIVMTIAPDLRAIQRQELIDRVVFAPRKAYRRGHEAGQADPDGICDPPDDL
jgi:hypothetical protein